MAHEFTELAEELLLFGEDGEICRAPREEGKEGEGLDHDTGEVEKEKGRIYTKATLVWREGGREGGREKVGGGEIKVGVLLRKHLLEFSKCNLTNS